MKSGRLANQSKLIARSKSRTSGLHTACKPRRIHPPHRALCHAAAAHFLTAKSSHSVFLSSGLRLPLLLCCALNSTLSLGTIAAQSYPLVTVISKKSQVVRQLVRRTGSAYEAVVPRQDDLRAGLGHRYTAIIFTPLTSQRSMARKNGRHTNFTIAVYYHSLTISKGSAPSSTTRHLTSISKSGDIRSLPDFHNNLKIKS